MKRTGFMVLSLLGAAVLVGSPAAHAKKAHHGVPCKEIKDAVASGKSEEDVAKDMKTSVDHVKSCTNPAPAHHHAPKKKAATTS